MRYKLSKSEKWNPDTSFGTLRDSFCQGLICAGTHFVRDCFVRDSFVQGLILSGTHFFRDSFVRDSFVRDSFVRDLFVQDSFVRHSFVWDSSSTQPWITHTHWHKILFSHENNFSLLQTKGKVFFVRGKTWFHVKKTLFLEHLMIFSLNKIKDWFFATEKSWFHLTITFPWTFESSYY